MRKIIAATLFAIVAFASVPAWADQFVNGYYRDNGTYVQPYWRSSPDNSYNNNFSVSPNVNPYTGQVGTKSPTWDDNPPLRGSLFKPFGTNNQRCGLLDPNCQ